jgi:two-component system, response regulator
MARFLFCGWAGRPREFPFVTAETMAVPFRNGNRHLHGGCNRPTRDNFLMNNGCFHLLYVEDDPSDAFFFTRALNHCSKKVVVHWAQSGQQAIAHLTDHSKPKPDLVICDINMPTMTGFEFLQWLRSSSFRRIPVVMLSGSVLVEDVNRAFHLGANAYVGKPTAADELLETMSKVVEFWCGTCVLPSVLEAPLHHVPEHVTDAGQMASQTK